MTRCVVIPFPGGTGFACTRGAPTRRVCDICDGPASGPKERLRDGTPFDVCASCRVGVEAVVWRTGYGDAEDLAVCAWGRLAGARVREALSGGRP